MKVSSMQQRPNSRAIRRPENLDGSAEPACVGNWSPRGFGCERAMIDFIRRWHRFGGGSARDIFDAFGISEHEFFTKTVELLGSTGASGVSEETANRIRKVCRWRPVGPLVHDGIAPSPTTACTDRVASALSRRRYRMIGR
jgi:hypothetical protein